MSRRFTPGPEQARALRDALGSFATGVTVITTMTESGPIGMTANSFASVSLDPALVLWSIDKGSDRLDVFLNARRYAIHVLAAEQQALSTGFARDPAHFHAVNWHEGADRVPALDEVLTRFDCRLQATHEAGDHVILIGEVLDVTMRTGAPLLFSQGSYAAVKTG